MSAHPNWNGRPPEEHEEAPMHELRGPWGALEKWVWVKGVWNRVGHFHDVAPEILAGQGWSYCGPLSPHPEPSPSQRDETGVVDLLPCPFCGGEAAPAKVRYSRDTVNEQGWRQSEFHYVSCTACGANNCGIVGHGTSNLAAERWNRRAAAPTPAQGGEAEAITSQSAVMTWLNEVEGYAQRMERFEEDIARGDADRMVDWMIAAFDLGRALPAPSAPGAEVMRLREALERIANSDWGYVCERDLALGHNKRVQGVHGRIARAALAPNAAPEEISRG